MKSNDISIILFITIIVVMLTTDKAIMDSTGAKLLSVVFFVNLVVSEKPIIAAIFLFGFITMLIASSFVKDSILNTYSDIIQNTIQEVNELPVQDLNVDIKDIEYTYLDKNVVEDNTNKKCGYVHSTKHDYSLIEGDYILPNKK